LTLAAFLTRDYWLRLLGLKSEPSALPTTTSVLVTSIPRPQVAVIPQPAVTLGTGDIQVTLTWNFTNDLDLWVTDPAGEVIYYHHPTSLSEGLLDYDANADCLQISPQPVENIFWPPGKAPKGHYRVEVQYYKQCESLAHTGYQVRMLVDGAVTEFSGTIQAQGDRQLIHAFVR